MHMDCLGENPWVIQVGLSGCTVHSLAVSHWWIQGEIVGLSFGLLIRLGMLTRRSVFIRIITSTRRCQYHYVASSYLVPLVFTHKTSAVWMSSYLVQLVFTHKTSAVWISIFSAVSGAWSSFAICNNSQSGIFQVHGNPITQTGSDTSKIFCILFMTHLLCVAVSIDVLGKSERPILFSVRKFDQLCALT